MSKKYSMVELSILLWNVEVLSATKRLSDRYKIKQISSDYHTIDPSG